jgi:hypothetical protein
MRKLILIGVLSVAAVGATTGIASAATNDPKSESQAAGTGTIIDYATSYTSPSDDSYVVHHLKPGEEVETYCFREGQVLNGNPYWFVIRSDDQTAYVHRNSISPPKDVRHC